MTDSAKRADLMHASAPMQEAVRTYTHNAFLHAGASSYVGGLPLPDEPQTATWLRYCDTARELGVYETLRQYLVQFQFPVREGMSQDPAYKAATLKGNLTAGMTAATGLELVAPEALELLMYQSPAGKIPVIIASHQQDFQRIVQALTARNEPRPFPGSMGAAMINGLNNWDRIRRMQAEWLLDNPRGNWQAHFRQNILPDKSCYQDKLILLSKKAYSGIPASALGLEEEQWLTHSLAIRLEHECTHFFTLRYFGCMANHMHDELIADYMGITKAVGNFRADWFLHFIGLENYPVYREGGRMQNYLGNPPLSPVAFSALRQLIHAAAKQVALFDQALGVAQTDTERTYRLLALCQVGLAEMATETGATVLLERYHMCAEAGMRQ